MLKTKFKIRYAIILMILMVVFVYGCGKKESTENKNDKQQTNQDKQKTDDTKLVENGKYVCPMHPTVQTDEPAKCPVCKMNLVTKEELNKEMSAGHEKLEDKYAGKPNLIHFEVNTSIIKSTDCQEILEKAVKSDPGLIDLHTDILNKVVHMYIDKTKTTKDNIEKLISDTGFDANNKKANPEGVSKLPKDCK